MGNVIKDELSYTILNKLHLQRMFTALRQTFLVFCIMREMEIDLDIKMKE